MSKKGDKSSDKAEDKKAKGKKGKKGKGDASGGPSIASHPRASFHVRRAKGWGGLAGFAVAAYVSYKAGVPMADLGLRSLAAGLIGYMLAWACAVTVWRHLVLAELRAVRERSSAIDRDVIPARATPKHAAPAGDPAAAPRSGTPAS
jgi:hypothetical protein